MKLLHDSNPFTLKIYHLPLKKWVYILNHTNKAPLLLNELPLSQNALETLKTLNYTSFNLQMNSVIP